jgi:hypothetical protein
MFSETIDDSVTNVIKSHSAMSEFPEAASHPICYETKLQRHNI